VLGTSDVDEPERCSGRLLIVKSAFYLALWHFLRWAEIMIMTPCGITCSGKVNNKHTVYSDDSTIAIVSFLFTLSQLRTSSVLCLLLCLFKSLLWLIC